MKLFALLAVSLCALVAQQIDGTWQGLAPNQPRELRLVFKIAKDGSGYQGTFYNLANGRQFNLGAITVQGDSISMVILGNGMTYQGKFDPGGNSITGNLLQGTNPTPLPLKRAAAETAWELPPAPTAPKPLPESVKAEFEVATIKPSTEPQAGTGGFNVTSTEMLARNISLAGLITFAYQVHRTQVFGLPDWADKIGYDLVARLPAGGDPSDMQLRTMLKNLLQSRFGLALHTDKREVAAYTINIGKNGLAGIKMVKNTSNGARMGAQGLGRTNFSGVTMADLANQLQFRVLDRPVIDQTGLTDRYDATLNWRPDEFQFPNATPAQRANAVANGADALPDIYTAFQEQLGLKLEANKASADALVVDKVARPTEN